MQDVVLHSTNVTKNYDTSNSNKKNLSLEKQLTSATTNSVSTIPITKLRLKSATTSNTNTLTNKRPIEEINEEESALKRLKMLDQIKVEVESEQLPFNYETEVKVKEEPLDDYESNVTPNLIPEVIIKTEEEEKTQTPEKPVMKSMIINNMIGPQSSGKFIPLESFVATENKVGQSPKTEMKTFSINNLVKANVNGKIINMNTQNLPVLKLITNNNNNINVNNTTNVAKKIDTKNLRYIQILPNPNGNKSNVFNNLSLSNLKANGKIMTLKLANPPSNLQNNNGNIKPLPKSGLQILKLLPNSQIMNLKSNANGQNLSGSKAPLLIKLQTAPTLNQLKINTNPLNSTLTTPTKTSEACQNSNSNINATAADKNSSGSTSPTVSIKLNSLGENTTIDAEDFKKLQAEALIKAEEHRKNFYVPKTRLMLIENIPEKKQLIDSMKQQIAEVETKTTEQIQGKPAGTFVLKTKPNDEPPTLYLPILTTLDVELVQARYENPNYTYKWICPYCLKDYEIKTALKMHLNKAHNLNSRDMEKINVQAKPFIVEGKEQQN